MATLALPAGTASAATWPAPVPVTGVARRRRGHHRRDRARRHRHRGARDVRRGDRHRARRHQQPAAARHLVGAADPERTVGGVHRARHRDRARRHHHHRLAARPERGRLRRPGDHPGPGSRLVPGPVAVAAGRRRVRLRPHQPRGAAGRRHRRHRHRGLAAVDPDPDREHFEVQSATRSAAGTWSAPETLDDREWGDRSPELAAGPNGQVAVAWGISGAATDDGVFVRIRQGAGAWAPRKRLGDEYWGGRADVAYAPDGTLGVVWASGFNTPTVTTLPPGGHWATPRVISHVEGQPARPPARRRTRPDVRGHLDLRRERQLRPGARLRRHRRHDRAVGRPGHRRGHQRLPRRDREERRHRGRHVALEGTRHLRLRRPGERPATGRRVGGAVDGAGRAGRRSSWQVALASGPAGSLVALVGRVRQPPTSPRRTPCPRTRPRPTPGRSRGRSGSSRGRRVPSRSPGRPARPTSAGSTRPASSSTARRRLPASGRSRGRPARRRTRSTPRSWKPGKHTVYVRAVQFGLTDPTPSARKFKVK